MDSRIAQEWLDQASYDLETAHAMWEAERFVYVLFCCQQAVEKSLKAIIIQKTGSMPPRSHSLPRLAELSEVTVEPLQMEFLAELSINYMRTRYPDESEKLAQLATREHAKRILLETKELVRWLQSVPR
jgi:HEPN domain-containing protein